MPTLVQPKTFYLYKCRIFPLKWDIRLLLTLYIKPIFHKFRITKPDVNKLHLPLSYCVLKPFLKTP